MIARGRDEFALDQIGGQVLTGSAAGSREYDSMRAIVRAHQKRNLADFEKALKDYKTASHILGLFAYRWPYVLRNTELSSDPTIRSHLAALCDTLEQNLRRIVEIEYVTQQMGQGRQAVEAKYILCPLFSFYDGWSALLSRT